MSLARNTHQMLARADRSCGTLSDYDDPRILGIAVSPQGNRLSTDLVFDAVVSWPLAGAKDSAPVLLQSLRGRLNAEVERALVSSMVPDDAAKKQAVLSTASILQAASEQGIAPAVLCQEKPEALKKIACEPWVRAILAERIAEGHVIFIPSRPVRMKGWPKPVTAWYEMDRRTGAWNGVLQDGRHAAMAEAKKLREILGIASGWSCTCIFSYMSTINTYAAKRINLTGSPKLTDLEIHNLAVKECSSFDWFSAYLEVLSAAMGSTTWNPKATAITAAGGWAMLVAGQQAALGDIGRMAPPSEP